MSRSFLFLFLLALNGFGQSISDCDSLLKMAIHDSQVGKYATALQFLNLAENQAIKNGWENRHFQAVLNRGNVYLNMEDYSKAIQYYMDAYTVAIKNENLEEEMSVLCNLGVTYSLDENYQKSLKYLRKALLLADRLGLKHKVCIYSINLSMLHFKQKDIKQALFYYNTAMDNYVPDKNTRRDIITLKLVYANIRMHEGKTSEVIKVLDSLRVSLRSVQSEYKMETAKIATLLSDCYLRQKQYSLGMYFADLALKDSLLPEEIKIKALTNLKEAYLATAQFEQAILCLDTINQILNRQARGKSTELYNKLKIKFELEEIEHDYYRSNKQNVLEKRILMGVVIGILIVVFFIGISISRKIKLKNKEEELLKSHNKIIGLELEKTLSDKMIQETILREKENLVKMKDLEIERNRSESELRNKELAEKEKTITISKLELSLKEQEAHILQHKNAEKEHLLRIAELSYENEQKERLIIQKQLTEQESKLKIYALETEREKNERLILEQQFKEAEIRKQLELKEQKEREILALLEIEKLKKELEGMTSKLSEKVAIQTGRNEAIEEVLSALMADANVKEDATLTAKINALKFQINEDLRWDDYIRRQSDTSAFIDKIKDIHNDLTPNDLRYLSYVLLKLDAKEMAGLLNITPEGVRKRKERILKKMNLPGGSDLYTYLKST
ncbi:MAG: tetratricopeptide repeat protein [Sediminibacterium sp.]|nr:tetratricopeptide repeat protein [Sediminibacterium sp.]